MSATGNPARGGEATFPVGGHVPMGRGDRGLRPWPELLGKLLPCVGECGPESGWKRPVGAAGLPCCMTNGGLGPRMPSCHSSMGCSVPMAPSMDKACHCANWWRRNVCRVHPAPGSQSRGRKGQFGAETQHIHNWQRL